MDCEGRVLVADCDNDRILLLNSQLQLQRVLIDNAHSQVKLWRPRRVCYDELTSRLYVADGPDDDWSSSSSEDDDDVDYASYYRVSFFHLR